MGKYSDQISSIFDQAEQQGSYLNPDVIDPVKRKQEPEQTVSDEGGIPDYNMLRGAVERGADLLSGLFRSGNEVAESAEEAMPMGGFAWRDGNVLPSYLGPDEYAKFKEETGTREPLDIASEYWKDASAGYVPNHTWEEVKRQFGESGPLSGSAWSEVMAYGAEQGIRSIPDMAAVVLNLPAYVTARSGEIGEERAKNKGKPEADLTDVLEASPFALGSALFERFGVKGFTKIKAEEIGKEALKRGFAYASGRVAAQGGKAAGREGYTEFVQEGIIEYAGEKFGTGSEMTLAEGFDRGLGGAVGGSVYGGGAGASSQAYQEITGKNRIPERPLSDRAVEARTRTQQSGGDELDATRAASEELVRGLTDPIPMDQPLGNIGGLMAQAQAQLDGAPADASPDLWSPSNEPRPYNIAATATDMTPKAQPLSEQVGTEQNPNSPKVVYDQDGVRVTQTDQGFEALTETDNGPLVAYGEDAGKARRRLERLVKDNAPQAPVLQNRDRSGQGYVAQMEAIAANPDYERVSISREPNSGAPMVFPQGQAPEVADTDLGRAETITMTDGQGGTRKIQARYAVVEADQLKASHNADGTQNTGYGKNGLIALNNGRTAGLQAAYSRGTAEPYREAMKADAEAHGIAQEVIAAKQNPVMVRLFDGAQLDGIADPGAASNESASADLSPSEQAETDARKLSPEILSQIQPGDPTGNTNTDFVRRAIDAIGKGNSDTVLRDQKTGLLTAVGQKRVRGALIQRAYNDQTLTRELVEAVDSDLKTLGDALAETAGRWALMHEQAKQGAINPDMDVTDALISAVNMIRKSRQEGRSLKDIAGQIDAFAGEADQMAVHILSLFYRGASLNRIRSKDAIVEALNNYTESALQSSPAPDMFGEMTQPQQVLERERERAEGTTTEETARGVRTDGPDNRDAGPEGEGRSRDTGRTEDAEGGRSEPESVDAAGETENLTPDLAVETEPKSLKGLPPVQTETQGRKAFQAIEVEGEPLSPEQSAAIRAYNDAEGLVTFDVDDKQARNLNAAARPLKKDLVVFRSDSFSESIADRVASGFRSLIPATTDETWASSWGDNWGDHSVQRITLKAGTPVVVINQGNTGEQEILIPGDQISVTRKRERTLDDGGADVRYGTANDVRFIEFDAQPKPKAQPEQSETTEYRKIKDVLPDDLAESFPSHLLRNKGSAEPHEQMFPFDTYSSFDVVIEQTKQEHPSYTNYEPGEVQPDGMVYTAENLMHVLRGLETGTKDMNGKLNAGKHRYGDSAPTPKKLLDTWIRLNQAENSVANSRKNHPEAWTAYDQRQKDLKALQKGDRVHKPYPSPESPHGAIGEVVRKGPKNWRVSQSPGSPNSTLIPIEALAPEGAFEQQGEGQRSEQPEPPEDAPVQDTDYVPSQARASKQSKRQAAPDLESQAQPIMDQMRRNAREMTGTYGGESLSPVALDIAEHAIANGRRMNDADLEALSQKHGVPADVIDQMTGSAFGWDFVLGESERSGDFQKSARALKSLTAERRQQTGQQVEPKAKPKAKEPEAKADDPRFSRTGPRNLFVAHNLSEQNLGYVMELGGLAAPSLAVGRTDQGFDDFGEVTLLAPASMLESSKARTFDADVYTPRQPRPEYEIDRDALQRQIKGLGNEYDLNVPAMDDLERDGMEAMARSPAYQYAWLKTRNKAPKAKRQKVDSVVRKIAKLGLDRFAMQTDPRVQRLATEHYRDVQKQVRDVLGEDAPRANIYFDEDGSLKHNFLSDLTYKAARYSESGGYDMGQMKVDLNKKLRPKIAKRQYERWVKERFSEVMEGKRMFNGFTPSGNRRYKPYTLENVVKEMTRQVQGGEGFNYGAGSVRSRYAQEMKRVSQVQANRDRIVSPDEMARLKEESNERLQEVLDQLRPYYRFDANSWGYMDDASSAIGEGPKGWNEAFDLDADGRAIITEFVDYLRKLPTAYFETKVGRAVDLAEFSVAIVPKGTSQEAVNALRAKGLKVKRYDPQDPDSRRAEIEKQEELLFTRDGEYRRTPNTDVETLTAAEARTIANNLMKDWKGRPGLTVADRISEFPDSLRAAIRLAGAESDMRAVFWNDHVYILAPRIPNRAALEEVVLHEVVGHYGLRKMVGKELNPLLLQVYNRFSDSDFAANIIRNYYPKGDFNPSNFQHRLTVAEELLAHLAETKRHQDLWTRIVAAIRKGLRRLGFTLEMTETDLLGILAGAQKTVEKGGFSQPSEADVNFSRNEAGVIEAASRFMEKQSKREMDALTKKAQFVYRQKITDQLAAFDRTDTGGEQSLSEIWLDYLDKIEGQALADAEAADLTFSELGDQYKRDIQEALDAEGGAQLSANDLIEYAGRISGEVDAFLNALSEEKSEIAFKAKSALQGMANANFSRGGDTSGSQPEPTFLKDEGQTDGLETGQPVTFNYRHNIQSAEGQFGAPEPGDRFGRDVEPAGRYMNVAGASSLRAAADLPNIETGQITFQNPIVVDNESFQWKRDLSEQYGGLTGRELSEAVLASGHDGIITLEPSRRGPYISEVVDLTVIGEPASPDIRFSRAGKFGSDRTAWAEDFPKVPLAAPLGSADKHPRYQAAKSGDVEAARELVDGIVNDAAIERIREMIGDRKPVVVPAFAEEASGRNMIPVAYAAKIAKSLGLTVDQGIVQSVSVKRTGEGSDYRLANHAVFEGDVTLGQDYIVVDDTLTMGGTLASLRGHIEANGGSVVGATTLTGFGNQGQLALGEKMRQALWDKHGAPLNEYLQEEFGYGIDSLTQGEAGHFRKAESLERIRERIDAARAEVGSDSTDGVDAPRFSRTGTPSETAAEAQSAYDKAFESLGDKDKTVFERAKKWLKKEMTPGGLLPDSVFKAKLDRDFQLNGMEFDIANRLGHFEEAVEKAYGKKYDQLTEEETGKINEALAGSDVLLSLPEGVREELHKMRLVIKGLSKEYAAHLAQEIEQLQEQGADAAAEAKIQLLETIINNLDTYVHRSYRAFEDPNWPRKVTREVYDAAAAYLEQRYVEQSDGNRVTPEIEDQVSKTLELMLEEGTAFDSMEAFIKESKLGAKDLSVLQRRKQIAPEIRALLGEYVDPKINFTKSVTKMSRLVMNQKFLDKVREIGLAEGFLFEEENRALDATRRIAADSSEVYAPLNGLYTFPEVEQAFRDALGTEQMADWFRTIVRLNGMVKYGKTVLSPTTAARNWMSASFFAMANGHFDFSQMKKSIQSVREYFTHGEGKDGYLRKLKELGVIYDTPYAGEMMDLLADSQLEQDLFNKGPFKNLRRMNEIAQKFYQYGDDFWKILGFENEKALLMKHRNLTAEQAEKEAAERIRNTYPTYSMTGRFVQRLRRFPLAGTFVSFPAEIVRTTYHIFRYAKNDLKQAPSLGYRKVAGLAIASGMIHALQAVAMSMVGMDDDEEEAFRDLAAPWQKNSNLLPLGRNEKGQIRLIDMSFLDPYNYWKRPINAMLRDQPVDEAIKSAAVDAWSPFFGQDIAFGAISEALSNQRESGGRVFNPHAPITDQAADIASHIRKALQPGAVANLERIVKASRGEISASGRPFSLKDEGAALVGFRITTFDAKSSLYYKAFEFQEKKRDATSILSSVARNPNQVSDSAIRDAYYNAEETRTEAYEDMLQLVKAGINSGLTMRQIAASLKNSGVSNQDIMFLVRGRIPPWRPSDAMMKNAIKKARVLFDDDVAKEFARRHYLIQKTFMESLKK